MPQFKIHHVTRYSYEVPVRDSANQIISSITSMLGKAGLDKDKDGDVDLGDVKKMLGF